MTNNPTPRTNILPLLTALLATALLSSACGGGIYDLPKPPDREQWTRTSLVPGEDEKASKRRYIDARAVALQLYAALKGSRYGDAWGMLSSETQAMLDYGSPSQDGKAALEAGELVFPDGSTYRFDPAGTFVIEDLRTFEDEAEGQTEAETDLRKEIYAVAKDGKIRKLVMIYETGQWKLHRTKVP